MKYYTKEAIPKRLGWGHILFHTQSPHCIQTQPGAPEVRARCGGRSCLNAEDTSPSFSEFMKGGGLLA